MSYGHPLSHQRALNPRCATGFLVRASPSPQANPRNLSNTYLIRHQLASSVIQMDVFDAIKTRRSIRSYRKEPIEEEKIRRVLEAARLAPSAANRQPWRFILVTDPEIRENLGAAYDREWFFSAPAIVVACAVPEEAWVRSDGEEYWKVDISIAMQNLVLAAWEEGLGTCWIGAFNEEEAKRVLDIPPKVRVVVMTPLGYPAEEKGPVSDRKPFEEIVRYHHW